VTTRPENASAVAALFELRGVPARRIGTVGGNQLVVHVGSASSHTKLAWDVSTLHAAWDTALDSYLA
jgi:hypothetical protein